MLLAVTAIAAAPRLALLGDIPPGLHGDEASAGLEARRILADGHIGAYSFRALGVPAGTFYWAAVVFSLLGESVFTLRLSFALLGIATVSLSYLAFRVMFGRSTAMLAALLLAVSPWHLHYSRVAFIPIGWPLAQMATLLFLFVGLRRQSRMWFALAGACLGAGMYTYQGFSIFALALGAAIVWLAIFHFRRSLVPFVAQVGTMLGVALLVGLPLASFAHDHPNVFLGRYREQNVTKSPEYEAAEGPFERAQYVATRELDYVRSVISRPAPDGVDAAGLFPLVDRVTLGLLIVGGAIAIWRVRSPPYGVVLVLTLIIGLGPALAVGGAYRRTLGLTPLLAVFAALPLVVLSDEARRRGKKVATAASVVVALVIGAVAMIGLIRYFGSYDDDPRVGMVYGLEMAAASRYMGRLPQDTFVYLYSDRWYFNFEGRQFLAPDMEGLDYGKAARGFSLENTQPRSRGVAWVFLEPYEDNLRTVQALYPGGESLIEYGDGRPLFWAYYLPPESGG